MASDAPLWLIAAFGVATCVAGYRAFILALALLGAGLGGYVGMLIGAQWDSQLAVGAGVAVGALAMGLVAVVAYRAGVGLLGAMFFGAAAAVLLAPFTPVVQIPGALLAAGTGAWVALFLQRTVIVLATAVHGALAAVLAGAVLRRDGTLADYQDAFSRIVSGAASPAEVLGGTGWLALWVGVAVTGIIVQLRGPREKRDTNDT